MKVVKVVESRHSHFKESTVVRQVVGAVFVRRDVGRCAVHRSNAGSRASSMY